MKLYPFRFCLKNTGPLDSAFMIIASRGVSHDNRQQITIKENKMSKILLINLLKGSSNKILLKESTGTKSYISCLNFLEYKFSKPGTNLIVFKLLSAKSIIFLFEIGLKKVMNSRFHLCFLLR